MVNYRLALEEDYPKVNDFRNRIYKNERTLDQFYWEFHNGPFGKSIYVIAEDGDKVVGTNCVIPIDLISADKSIIRTGKSEDTLVDPDYRGQNIFYNIYEFLFEKCKEQGIKVIWGFTSAKKPFEKMGFSIPFDHSQNLAVNKILPSYKYLTALNSKNKFMDKFKILGLCVYSKFNTFGSQNGSLLSQYRITAQEEISAVDTLIQSNLDTLPNSFAIHQNKEFQAWRIYKNPNFHKVHTFGFYDQSGNLKAVIVFNSHPDKVAYVCQTTFAPELSDKECATETELIFKSRFVVPERLAEAGFEFEYPTIET